MNTPPEMEAGMTAQLATARRRARRRNPSLEYRVYYAVLFLVALPVACVKWMIELPRDRLAGGRSPIGAAHALTATVLPYIFMA